MVWMDSLLWAGSPPLILTLELGSIFSVSVTSLRATEDSDSITDSSLNSLSSCLSFSI